jgi:hypothetical protein
VFKELEIVVLRHELAVLRRQSGRAELKSADRVFLAAAASWLLPRSSWRSFVVTPDAASLAPSAGRKALDMCGSSRPLADRRRDSGACASLRAREPAVGLEGCAKSVQAATRYS